MEEKAALERAARAPWGEPRGYQRLTLGQRWVNLGSTFGQRSVNVGSTLGNVPSHLGPILADFAGFAAEILR